MSRSPERSRNTRIRILTVAAAIAFCTSFSDAVMAEGTAERANWPEGEDWLQFRGPDRSGVAPDTGSIHGWPPGGPRILWKIPLGEGFSEIVTKEGLAYTLFADSESDFVIAVRIEDGSESWRRKIGRKFFDQWGNGPRSTPTIDGDMIFVVASYGDLYALDRIHGAVVWSVELGKAYPPLPGLPRFATLAPPEEKIDPSEFAHASSPLVEGDLLIVYTGSGYGKSLVAFDKKTGYVRWTALDKRASYSSPTAMTLHGVRQIVSVLDTDVASVDLNGNPLWEFALGWSLTQPLHVAPDGVFVSAPLDIGGILLGTHFDGGKWRAEPIWKNRLLRTGWSSPVVFDGRVYGFDHATLRCLSLESGEVIWAKRGFGKGSIVVADALLLVLSDQGELVLAKPGADEFEELGRMRLLDGRSWTAATVVGGKVLARDHQEMVAIDMTEPNEK